MQQRRLTILSLLCALLGTLGASDLGPPVGSPFPGRAIKSILGPKGAAVLCYQAADEMPQFNDQDAFRKLGLGITAVRSTLPSGWYMLNARGLIVSKFLDQAGERYTPGAVLVHQFGWSPTEPGAEVEGKQLSAKTGASNATVAPGQRVALTLDLDLNPGMHVYAPGVQGYIPIDWKMQDSPAATILAPVFPHSVKLYLKAIGETVPAYRGRFRLTRDITVGPALDSSGNFTVTGSLRYQACDDRVCYIPQELHLTWAFQYSALNK